MPPTKKQKVSRPRLLLAIFQALFALLSLICLGSLSSTQCWHHEPSERGYLWWLTPSTVLVAVGAWYLEAFRADILFKTGLDSVALIFWIGGIGAAGQLNTLTAEVKNCQSHHGPYPETGAVTAFAVFEVLLFAAGVYHIQKGIPWPQSDNDDANCEYGTRSQTAANSTAPMSHLQSGDFSEYVTIHVGEGDNKRNFPVPKGPICRRSKWVKAAVSDAWIARLGRSSTSKEVDLSDDDPENFEVYLQCVMGNTVAIKDYDKQQPTRLQSDNVLTRLINTYILADKLEDPESMNLIIDKIAGYCLSTQTVPSCEAVKYAYDSTVKTSPLRLLLVDVYQLGHDGEATSEEHLEGMPTEFLVQYSQAAPPNVQTVVAGSQRYHVPVDKQQIFRGLFQTSCDA